MKKAATGIKAVVFSGLFLIQAICFALPFTIVPKAGTNFPTAVSNGTNATAYYTVSNNTLSPRNGNYVKYLPPNTKQVTVGGFYPDTCGTSFNLSSKGHAGDSCTLQLSITGAINGNDTNPHHHLFVCFPGGVSCAGTRFPLNVSKKPTVAYISNFAGQNITQCPLLDNSLLGKCTSVLDLAPGQTLAIALNPKIPMAYVTVTNFPGIGYCHINDQGIFDNCNGTATGTFLPGIAVNSNASYIYATNVSANSVTYCPLEADGTPNGCNDVSANFDIPYKIALTPAGVTPFAYIANQAMPPNDPSFISSCGIDPGTGNLINCLNSVDPLIELPYALAVNPGNLFLYVANSGGIIAYCPRNLDGSLRACTSTGTNFFNFPTDITFNAAGTYAFITNQNGNNISSCPINADGSFGICLNSGIGLDGPDGIALL